MSVVTVTELVPGEVATSTDVNATLTSFNNATAAGALNGVNFNVEGLDRRSFPNTGNVVEELSNFFSNATTSGPVNSVAYAVIPMAAGAAPMETTPGITAPATAMLVLHASVRVACGAIATTVNLPQVWLQLEQSTNGGGAWTKLTGSERQLRMRDVGVNLCSDGGATAIPGINQTVSWAQYVATTNVSTIFRATYRTANGSFSFYDAIISPEVILK